MCVFLQTGSMRSVQLLSRYRLLWPLHCPGDLAAVCKPAVGGFCCPTLGYCLWQVKDIIAYLQPLKPVLYGVAVVGIGVVILQCRCITLQGEDVSVSVIGYTPLCVAALRRGAGSAIAVALGESSLQVIGESVGFLLLGGLLRTPLANVAAV